MRMILFGLIGSLFLISGCTKPPKLVSVMGQVMHKDKPVTAGSIWFQADGVPTVPGEPPLERGSCQLAIDGKFVIRTYPWGDGVMPGHYKITLAPEIANRLRLPKYADVKTTPWEIDVPESGLMDLMLTVK